MSGNSSCHDQIVGLVLPRPSTVFQMFASTDTPWVAQTLSHCTPMNRGLGIPYVPYASVH
jgi:hypothetical protein